MKLNAQYRYLLNEAKKALIVFYIVVIAAMLVTGIFASLGDGVNMHANASINMSFSSTIFVFIMGLVSFKDNFFFALQSGSSRRTLFFGTLLDFASICVITSVVDFIISRLFILAFAPGSTANLYDLDVGSSLVISFMLITLGYCITIMFYRLNRVGKIAVGAGVPVFFFVALPIIDVSLTGGDISRAIIDLGWNVLQFMHRGFFNMFLVCGGMAAVFALFSWLMMRRAGVKR